MNKPAVAAMILFNTEPTDRALAGWMPSEAMSVVDMTDTDRELYASELIRGAEDVVLDLGVGLAVGDHWR